MLHMIVSVHGPDTCPMANPVLAKKTLAQNERMAEVNKKYGVTVQGAWTDMGAHTTFMLVDAPNAHVLGKIGMELELMNWNTSKVYPVLTMQEAMSNLK